MKRIATALIALVLFAVPAHSEQVALVGFGWMEYQYEDASVIGLGGWGGDYLYFGEENNLFFGANLARLHGWGPCYLFDSCGNRYETWNIFSLSAGYDLENSLFTPYVSLLHSRLKLDFGTIEETSSDTSLGLGTYMGTPGRRWYATLLGIGADEQTFAVGAYRTLPNDLVFGSSYETRIDDLFNSATIYLRIGYSF